MRRARLLTVIRATAGLILGVLLWWTAIEPYNRLLCTMGEPMIRALERPRVTRLHHRGSEITVDRADFRRGGARPALDTRSLTVNIVLVFALFAANAGVLSTRNVVGFVTAVGVLILIHLFAIAVNVQSIYALKLGAWSSRHYGPFARNFWGAAAQFYTLVGMFGSAFLLWWLLRPAATKR